MTIGSFMGQLAAEEADWLPPGLLCVLLIIIKF